MIVNPEMYEEGSACFDPTLGDTGFSQNIVPNCSPTFSMEDQQVLAYPQQDAAAAAAAAAANSAVAAAMELEFQQQTDLGIDNCYNPNSNMEPHLMQDVPNHQFNWETHEDMNYSHYNQIQEMHTNNSNHQSFINTETPYPQTPDLLNLLHLPRCSSSLLPNSSISFSNPTHNLGFLGDLRTAENGLGSSVLFDPMLHLNLPPQPPLFRDSFQSLPHGYNLQGERSGSLFGGVEEMEGSGDLDNVVFDFGRGMNSLGRGREGKHTKHFATERQRRLQLNDKYDALKQLVPNPTKPDRASVVGDAIEYIKELQRTVNELKVLVEKKRYSRERFRMRHKTEDDSVLEGESTNMKPHGDAEQACNGPSLRSSWLQRKAKNAEVDVRIVDDEVTIKLVQQKRVNCLLFVSKILDELQLDLQHVAGGLIGDFYSFLFNSKICEGSSVYASAIANKLIDVVDRQYAASQPSSSY